MVERQRIEKEVVAESENARRVRFHRPYGGDDRALEAGHARAYAEHGAAAKRQGARQDAEHKRREQGDDDFGAGHHSLSVSSESVLIESNSRLM